MPRAAAAPSSSSSSAGLPPNTSPLLRLPAEALTRVFAHACNGVPKADRPGPICKGLLPAQRRQSTSLNLPKPANDWHQRQLLSQAENLESLTCAASPDLPGALLALPHPTRLRNLVVHTGLGHGQTEYADFKKLPSLDASIAPALARFTALRSLEIHCHSDLSSPSVRSALASTALETLILGCKTLEGDDVLAFVTPGPSQLKQLKTLELHFVEAEAGISPDEADKPWHFDASWELPMWWKNFTREKLEEVMKAAKKVGVEVKGLAVEAMEVEDAYREAKKKFDAPKRRRDRAVQWQRKRDWALGRNSEDEMPEFGEDEYYP
ncbi:hypothetical protein JCM10213_000324 [Rhodosporidiobolus nylandii]